MLAKKNLILSGLAKKIGEPASQDKGDNIVLIADESGKIFKPPTNGPYKQEKENRNKKKTFQQKKKTLPSEEEKSPPYSQTKEVQKNSREIKGSYKYATSKNEILLLHKFFTSCVTENSTAGCLFKSSQFSQRCYFSLILGTENGDLKNFWRNFPKIHDYGVLSEDKKVLFFFLKSK